MQIPSIEARQIHSCIDQTPLPHIQTMRRSHDPKPNHTRAHVSTQTKGNGLLCRNANAQTKPKRHAAAEASVHVYPISKSQDGIGRSRIDEEKVFGYRIVYVRRITQ
jgi:hypothetical protein